MVAWPPTTVAWPFSDFFQNVPKSLETSKKRCLTVGRRSCDLNHCRVTVQRIFSKFFQIDWNVRKTLFDSRPTVAWPPTTLAWPFSDFFKIFPNCLKRPKNVVWQSADGRVTSTTVAWPFSDFYQNFPKSIWTSKKRCLTVGRRSRDLRPLSRDRSVTFFKKISNCLKRRKNVVWQSADSRVTSDHCRVTVQRLFSKFFQLLNTSENSCLTVSRRSRHLRLGWKVEQILFESQRTVTWRSGYFVPVVFFRTASHTASQMYISFLFFFLLSAEQLGHVSPPTGMVQSWKFWHHMKARDK